MSECLKIIFMTDEKDYICFAEKNMFLKEAGHIVCFSLEEVADKFAQAKGISIGDTICFDLSLIAEFIEGGETIKSPALFLDFWNIMSDLSYSASASFLGDDDNDSLAELYDTLFYMVESGEAVPFSKDDLLDLKEVLKDGINLILSTLIAL